MTYQNDKWGHVCPCGEIHYTDESVITAELLLKTRAERPTKKGNENGSS